MKRNARAKFVRLRMTESGELSVTLPRFASVKHAYDLVESSREQIRTWQKKYLQKPLVFNDGDLVGRSHQLRFTPTQNQTISVRTTGLTIGVHYPETLFHTDPKVQKAAIPHIQKALQKEARAYLPRRLKHLAEQYGFHYARVRYGTQKGRWGSCSSTGTISLNVGLMLLEPELIDYVLIHELCHTKQMNHSSRFWALVEQCLPDYKARRKQVKLQKPTL